jgi:thiol-disulfide isomerase/thioredoxin
VLLIAFIVGIANALARGEQPDCHCFGAIHSAPVGRGQVARNVGLGAVALFVVATGPGPSIDGWIASRNGAELAAGALTVAALGLAWFGLQSWVENRRLREALEEARDIARAVPPGLPAGASAPEFAIRDGGDRQLTLEGLRSRGRPIALVFMRPGCGPCATQVPEFVRWQESLGERLSIGLVGLGALERFEEAASRLHANLSEVLARDGDLARETDELAEVLTAYRIRATPSAVIVNPEGTIASATVDGRPAIEGLIRLALSRRTQT